jgi:hypothetical protein
MLCAFLHRAKRFPKSPRELEPLGCRCFVGKQGFHSLLLAFFSLIVRRGTLFEIGFRGLVRDKDLEVSKVRNGQIENDTTVQAYDIGLFP